MVPAGKFFLHEIPIPAITSSSSNESSQFEERGRPIDVIVSPFSKHSRRRSCGVLEMVNQG
jgi:hypothetical protein